MTDWAITINRVKCFTMIERDNHGVLRLRLAVLCNCCLKHATVHTGACANGLLTYSPNINLHFQIIAYSESCSHLRFQDARRRGRLAVLSAAVFVGHGDYGKDDVDQVEGSEEDDDDEEQHVTRTVRSEHLQRGWIVRESRNAGPP